MSRDSYRGGAAGRWMGPAGVIALLAAGCASQPPEALDSARQAVEAAREDPQIAENASVALREAEQQLAATEQAWEADEDADEVEHRAYLTERKVELARVQAEQTLAQQEIDRLAEQRQQVLLESRTREAQAAERRAEMAKMEAASSREEVQQLEQSLADLKAQAEETERGTVLTLGEMLFGFDQAQLEPGAERKLQPLASFLQENADREVIVEGHTDAVGSEEYNRQLSERRALAVRNYLIRQGVAPDRIETQGYGPQYPVAPNDTPAGRQQNRRVDVVILESGQDAAGSLRR